MNILKLFMRTRKKSAPKIKHGMNLQEELVNPFGETWFVSDPHFYHKNVIHYCKRPWANIHDMNEGIIESWNKHIKPFDIVFLLGDISWKGHGLTKEVINRLNGKIFLILGNHDTKVSLERWSKPDYGFAWVGFDLTVNLGEFIINLSHFPYYPKWWQKIQARFNGYDVRHLGRRLYDDGRWLIHGHVHTKWKVNGRMINAGMDAWGWRPMHLNEALEIMRKGPKLFRVKPDCTKVETYSLLLPEGIKGTSI